MTALQILTTILIAVIGGVVLVLAHDRGRRWH